MRALPGQAGRCIAPSMPFLPIASLLSGNRERSAARPAVERESTPVIEQRPIVGTIAGRAGSCRPATNVLYRALYRLACLPHDRVPAFENPQADVLRAVFGTLRRSYGNGIGSAQAARGVSVTA